MGILILLIVFIVLSAYLLFLGKQKNSWRKQAIVLSAVYLVEMERSDGDQESSFFRAFNFRYSPDYIDKAKKSGQVIDPTRIHPEAVVNRYLRVLRLKEGMLPGLISTLMDNETTVNLQPKVADLFSFSDYYFLDDDFGLQELVYCMLVVEFPQTVRGLPRDSVTFITHFLQIAKSQIQATAQDRSLVQDVELLNE